MTFNRKRQHGEFCIDVCEGVVLINARGPWNLECVQHFEQAYRNTVYQSGMINWVDIICLQGESLLVPDAEKSLKKGIARASAVGLKAVFVILEQSMVASTSLRQLENLYRDLSVTLNFAAGLGEAVKAANNEGYSVSFESASTFFCSAFTK